MECFVQDAVGVRWLANKSHVINAISFFPGFIRSQLQEAASRRSFR